MPDICLCHGTDNELCQTCVRNDKNTKPDNFQSYFLSTPILKRGKCEYYSNINEW